MRHGGWGDTTWPRCNQVSESGDRDTHLVGARSSAQVARRVRRRARRRDAGIGSAVPRHQQRPGESHSESRRYWSVESPGLRRLRRYRWRNCSTHGGRPDNLGRLSPPSSLLYHMQPGSAHRLAASLRHSTGLGREVHACPSHSMGQQATMILARLFLRQGGRPSHGPSLAAVRPQAFLRNLITHPNEAGVLVLLSPPNQPRNSPYYPKGQPSQ